MPIQESKRSLDFPAKSPKPSKISRPDEIEEELAEEVERDQPIMSQNTKIQRYLVAFEYIGTRFFGSQKQPSHRTVTGVLEEAFEKFVGQHVSIVCSSRTDTGVHALCNVCHVDMERISKRKPSEVLTPHEPGVVKRAVNHFLQKEGDISVIDVQCVPRDFHSRYKALERTYFYRMLCGPDPLSAFDRERAWHLNQDLNIMEMKKACSILAGHHDFSSFRASGCQALSPIRTLDELHVCEVVPSLYFPSELERKENGSESIADNSLSSHTCMKNCSNKRSQGFGHIRSHRCYVVTARARSFLYHQVRLLVGLLKCVGTGEVPVSKVEEILNAKSIAATSPMAPACGLYLGNVKYDLPNDPEI